MVYGAMLAKSCFRSHGQPVSGVRSAAMMSSRRRMSREGVMRVLMADLRERRPAWQALFAKLPKAGLPALIRIRHIMEYISLGADQVDPHQTKALIGLSSSTITQYTKIKCCNHNDLYRISCTNL